MFKNKYFIGILSLAILGILFYSLKTGSNSTSEKDYVGQIQEERKTSDEFMKNNSDSPIAEKDAFQGLKYFPIDVQFKIVADYSAVDGKSATTFFMTDSTKGTIKKVADLTFDYQGKKVKLGLFKEETLFFLPFKDLSNGKETYGGGRFINIPFENLKDGKIIVDFNLAHNFYCAYNHTFVCPVPPSENSIPFEIRAGEKLFQ